MSHVIQGINPRNVKKEGYPYQYFTKVKIDHWRVPKLPNEPLAIQVDQDTIYTTPWRHMFTGDDTMQMRVSYYRGYRYVDSRIKPFKATQNHVEHWETKARLSGLSLPDYMEKSGYIIVPTTSNNQSLEVRPPPWLNYKMEEADMMGEVSKYPTVVKRPQLTSANSGTKRTKTATRAPVSNTTRADPLRHHQ